MKLQRVKELMEIERECVTRGSECDRDCGNCELVQDADELIEAFNIVIIEMNKRIASLKSNGVEIEYKFAK